jgi:hypothetical protein
LKSSPLSLGVDTNLNENPLADQEKQAGPPLEKAT